MQPDVVGSLAEQEPLEPVNAAPVAGPANAAPVAGPANAAPAADCTLTMGNVYYSANMLYAGAWLSGDCHGSVWVELQTAPSASGPWTTVDSAGTYPTNPDAQGGTAWFDDNYGCGWFRAQGTYGNLTAVSPRPNSRCY